MWLEILLFVLAVVWVWYVFKTDPHTLALGNKIPGPRSYPIIGNLLDIPRDGAVGIVKRAEMIREFGHVCRMWLGKTLIVLISDPKDTEVIFNSSLHIDKSQLYDFFHPWLGTGLLTSKGEKWHARRKAITPTFHFKILEQFLEVFNRNGEILIDCLKKEAGGDHFNVQPYLSRYALDVICESAMGTEVHAQRNTKSEYVVAVRRICEVIFKRMNKPWLWNTLLFFLSGGLYAQTTALKTLHGLTNKVIEDKKKILQSNGDKNDKKLNGENVLGVKNKTAFLELLLQMSEKSKRIFQTDTDIREEVDTFMFEGHDTTTSAVCFTLHLLAKHPDVQEKVFAELQELGVGGRSITVQDLQDMKYLERVIKESLRLFPSVPIVSRLIKEDVKLNSGYVLPSGCMVGLSVYFIHRNGQYYNNPEQFNPDNFISDVTSQRHPYAYIPFSAGPRNCIGQKFAMYELKATIAKIVCNFRLDYAGPQWDVIPNAMLVLQSVNDFHIKLTLRP